MDFTPSLLDYNEHQSLRRLDLASQELPLDIFYRQESNEQLFGNSPNLCWHLSFRRPSVAENPLLTLQALKEHFAASQTHSESDFQIQLDKILVSRLGDQNSIKARASCSLIQENLEKEIGGEEPFPQPTSQEVERDLKGPEFSFGGDCLTWEDSLSRSEEPNIFKFSEKSGENNHTVNAVKEISQHIPNDGHAKYEEEAYDEDIKPPHKEEAQSPQIQLKCTYQKELEKMRKNLRKDSYQSYQFTQQQGFIRRVMDGNLILTKSLRADIVIKTLLRYMKNIYKKQFYEQSKIPQNYYRLKGDSLLGQINLYLEATFSSTELQKYNLSRKKEGRETLTPHNLAFTMGAIFLNKALKRESPEASHKDIETLHGTLQSFYPAKLKNLKKYPGLNFLLRNFLDNYAEEALMKDAKLAVNREEYLEGVRFLKNYYC